MALIYETENFIVESYERPFVSREEGGNIRIIVKDTRITDRTKLTPKQAVEVMRLSMVVGEALEKAMNNRGVPVVKINYQDMGNWAAKLNKKPCFHIHIFGRSKNAIKQPYPESVYLPDRSSGFYNDFKPLNKDDIQEIKKCMQNILKQKKYDKRNWGGDY